MTRTEPLTIDNIRNRPGQRLGVISGADSEPKLEMLDTAPLGPSLPEVQRARYRPRKYDEEFIELEIHSIGSRIRSALGHLGIKN